MKILSETIKNPICEGKSLIKIENTVTPSKEQWKAVIMGMRNPHNSWQNSDSDFENFKIGEKDHELMMKLAKAGTDHRKYLRMLVVYTDVTAPLYWFKEYDTYKVATVANSCSTMHTICEKEFTLDDFSHEHLDVRAIKLLQDIVDALNDYRDLYINYNADDFEIKGCPSKKDIWWQLIQLLPSSYNQKRTIMLSYEVLANIYRSRKGHKLDEWNDFCDWITTLPCSELITENNL